MALPQTDFYSQIGSGRPAALPDHVFGRDAAANSSVAATIGSASSVASLNLKPATFKIYPADESSIDHLITKALVVGDFESAVELALSTDRFADAILLSVRGGPDLLAKTQKAYFERQTNSLPYLRVFQSIVGNDLSDVVQNADLADWQEIFVVLCTFAQPDEFPGLTAQLGQRLEYQHTVAKRSPSPELAPAFRKNAILCYLASGQLEKVVGIWIEQMKEDEEASQLKDEKLAGGGAQYATAKYDARAKSLQAFVEKVTVFQHAVGYVDVDLTNPADVTETGPKTYKLAALYERYVEYAELLAAQGLVSLALKYVAQTPADFEGLTAESASPALTRDRLVRATGGRPIAAPFAGNKQIGGASAVTPVASTSTSEYAPPAQTGGYKYPTPDQYDNRYQNPLQQQPAYAPPPSNQYAPPPSNQYAPPASAQSNPYAPVGASSRDNYDDPYASTATSSYGNGQQGGYQPQPQPTYGNQQASFPPPPPNQYGPPSNSFLPTPPIVRDTSPSFAPRPHAAVPPPRPKQGWNDAPPPAMRKSTPHQAAAATQANKPEAITSPFPNAPAQPVYAGNFPPGHVPPPPPSRGSNRTPAQNVAPPLPRGQGFQPPPTPQTLSPPPPPSGFQGPPPGQQQRFPGPPGQQQQQHPGPPRPPQQGGPYPPQGAPNFRGAPTSPPNAGGYGRPNPGPPGPYGPPGGQQQQQQHPGQQQHQQHPSQQGRPSNGPQGPAPPGPYAAPPAAPGPYGPPPGSVRGPPGSAPPPPSFNNPNSGHPAPQRSQPSPAPAPPKPEPPKSKYRECFCFR